MRSSSRRRGLPSGLPSGPSAARRRRRTKSGSLASPHLDAGHGHHPVLPRGLECGDRLASRLEGRVEALRVRGVLDHRDDRGGLVERVEHRVVVFVQLVEFRLFDLDRRADAGVAALRVADLRLEALDREDDVADALEALDLPVHRHLVSDGLEVTADALQLVRELDPEQVVRGADVLSAAVAGVAGDHQLNLLEQSSVLFNAVADIGHGRVLRAFPSFITAFLYLGISEVIHRLDNDSFSQLSPGTSYALRRRAESVACRRSLTFAVQVDDPRAKWLLGEFRLIVNKSIRIAMAHDIRSRTRLARVAYHDLSADHRVHKKYILSAFDVALGLLKGHRRRIRKNRKSSPPFVRKPMLIAANQSYWLDRETGRLRIPIRGTEGIQLYLPLSEWHRSLLTDSTSSFGNLTVVPGKIIVLVRKASPPIHEPMSLIALDTNEDSMDGVACSPGATKLVAAPLGGVRLVQATHFRRRRRLASKKAHDWRVRRRLLAFEGRRERNRVRQRLR